MKAYYSLILFLGLITSACSKDNKNITTKVKEVYNEGLRKTFVKNGIEECIKNVGSEDAREACECAMNKLNESLTDDEIVNMTANKEPEDMEQRIDKAVEECLQGK